uniref:Uncharacterized protein n=1 Tax=Rhizophora mucronata TaxID=61149 RepID=A0A2P2MXB2_RHIMU
MYGIKLYCCMLTITNPLYWRLENVNNLKSVQIQEEEGRRGGGKIRHSEQPYKSPSISN